MGYLVGIDFGTKRTGLALTDPNKIIASGLKNLPTDEVIAFLEVYCQKIQVASFIVGQPLQKDGSPSAIEERIQEFIHVLKKKFPTQNIERYDERFTSKVAFQAMIDGGLKKKQRKKKGMIDQVSATLILQSYLDYKLNKI